MALNTDILKADINKYREVFTMANFFGLKAGCNKNVKLNIHFIKWFISPSTKIKLKGDLCYLNSILHITSLKVTISAVLRASCCGALIETEFQN